MIKPALDAATYATERAICDKASAYAELTMRGRVEQYELLTNPPELFTAYIGKGGTLTTWCGDVLGTARMTGGYKARGVERFNYRCTMAGHEYAGSGEGEGMMINLRRIKRG